MLLLPLLHSLSFSIASAAAVAVTDPLLPHRHLHPDQFMLGVCRGREADQPGTYVPTLREIMTSTRDERAC